MFKPAKLVERYRKEKRAEYFDITFLLNAKYNYLATSANGHIYSFVLKPEVDEANQIWRPLKHDRRFLGIVEFEGDWKESLVEI